MEETARMNIYVTRDSVAAGDYVHAPHAKTFATPQPLSLAQAVRLILDAGYLPSISGGRATWSVASGLPIAVVAQQWTEPRVLFFAGDEKALDRSANLLRLHFSYFAQREPDVVLDVLGRLRLRAL